MTNGWQVYRMSDLLTQNFKGVKVVADKSYKLLGVRLEGRGAFLRQEKSGGSISANILNPVRAGDFIYSRLFAWRGAFGIVPEELDGCFVSGEFPTFTINTEKLLPKFLRLFFARSVIWEEVEKYCTGTTKASRNRFKEQFFLRFEIPIPSLEEQRRIVKRFEALSAHITKAQFLRKEAEENRKFLHASIMNSVFEGRLVLSEENSESADELVERNLLARRSKRDIDIRLKGKDPSKTKYEELQSPNTNELPTLPKHWQWVTWEMLLAHEDGAFRRGPFGSTLRKSIFVESGYKVYEQYCPINDDCSFGRYYVTPEMFKKLKSFEVKAGDFLISCSGVTLGRITQVPQGSDEGIINQALLRVRINNKIIDDKYFLYCFRAPFFQKLLFVNSTGSAIPNLKGVKELKAIPMPLPPLDEQWRIVAYLDSVQARLASLRELQSATGEELSALLPSVLDRAFKGEL